MLSKQPSIIVPLWCKTSESADVAAKCISILRKLSPGAEVLVVNDCSPVSPPLPYGTKLITNAKNKGLAASWNVGIFNSVGDYLVFINSDVVVHEGWLPPLLETIDTKYDGKEIGAVSPVLAESKEQAEQLRQNGPDVMPGSTGCCFMMKKLLIGAFGGFDEQFFPCYFEDEDMWRRIEHRGMARVIDARSSVTHLMNKTTSTMGDRNEVFERNRKRFEKKWPVAKSGRWA